MFVDEARRRGLYVNADGATWRFWCSDDCASGWKLSVYGELGVALLFGPDEGVTVLRAGWKAPYGELPENAPLH
jgi:hypothetical protein